MTKKLGKGLNAIFGDNIDDFLDELEKPKDGRKSDELSLSLIRSNPYQPRKVFNDTKIEELTASIKEHGVFQPILVRQALNGYELIAGERRLRAAKLAGLTTIPAIVISVDDRKMMEISLLENIQRENLTAIEEAEAYRNLLEKLDYTQEKLAQRIGKSRAQVTNMLRLLKLPTAIRDLVNNEQLTYGHARALLAVNDEDRAIVLAQKAVREGMSVRMLEEAIKVKKTKKKLKKELDPNLENVRLTMERKLGTGVNLKKHQIVISYRDNRDLNRILEILDCLAD